MWVLAGRLVRSSTEIPLPLSQECYGMHPKKISQRILNPQKRFIQKESNPQDPIDKLKSQAVLRPAAQPNQLYIPKNLQSSKSMVLFSLKIRDCPRGNHLYGGEN